MIKKVLSQQLKQILQFLIIGSLNAIIDIGLLDIITWIYPTNNTFLLLAFNTFAYFMAITNSYYFNSRFTFKVNARKNHQEKNLFLLQALTSLVLSNITFLIGLLIFPLFHLSVWWVQNVAKILAMAIPSTASFFFMKFIVFAKQGEIVRI